MHIKFVWVGKTKNEPIRSLTADYLGRLRHLISCEVIEVPDVGKRRALHGETLLTAEGAAIEKLLCDRSLVVVLDENGRQFSSVDFAAWFEAQQNRGGREVFFVIGGPEGISSEISGRAQLKLSLGRMTWTHEMCRVLLLEQVYRALSILRKIPYHK
jgi:23S rRNA (pseudouridine1915-N3)-methyltransferase